MVKLDVMESGEKKQTQENPGGKDVMDSLGGAKSGIPFFAILDEKGKKLADSNALPGGKNIGYPAAPEEIAAFEEILKRTATRMKEKDRTRLIEHLKKVAPH